MRHRRSQCGGFSIVELMIAMVLGLILIGGAIVLFTGIIRTSSMNQAISDMQSKARFALDMMGRDVRAAGFLGCSSGDSSQLYLAADNPPSDNLADSAIAGFNVSSTGWEPDYPVSYSAPADTGSPVPGTQALSVQYGEYPGFEMQAAMSAPDRSIRLENNDEISISAGELMVIADCVSADLFTLGPIVPASTTTVQPTQALQKSYGSEPVQMVYTRAMPFVSTVHYIGDTKRLTKSGEKIYSLYAHEYPYTAANKPMEIAEGVDQLVLEFGIRTAYDKLMYVNVDSSDYEPSAIETVRIGLLFSSQEKFRETDTTRVFQLAGQKVYSQDSSSAPAGSYTYPADKRLRLAFNATFNVRNRDL